MLESIAYDQYLALRALQDTYPEAAVKEVTVYGGGSKSSLWNQIKADVMGLPYVSLAREDVGALGTAILAGYAVGIYDDMAATAERFARQTSLYRPEAEAHRFYKQYADYYGRLLDQVEPAFDDLAALPEWKA